MVRGFDRLIIWFLKWTYQIFSKYICFWNYCNFLLAKSLRRQISVTKETSFSSKPFFLLMSVQEMLLPSQHCACLLILFCVKEILLLLGRLTGECGWTDAIAGYAWDGTWEGNEMGGDHLQLSRWSTCVVHFEQSRQAGMHGHGGVNVNVSAISSPRIESNYLSIVRRKHTKD